MKKLILSLVFIIFSIVLIHAQKGIGQTVYLKTGSVISGYVDQDMTTGKVKITGFDGNIFVFNVSEVDSIISNHKKTGTTVNSNPNTTYEFKQKGFYNITEFTLGLSLTNSPTLNYGLSGVFGYQFSPQLTLGAGVAGELWYRGYSIPIFLDVRYYPVNRRASPYIGFQGGYHIAGVPLGNTYFNGGLYLSPLVGARVYVSKKVGLNFGLSYQLRQFTLYPNSVFGNFVALRLGVSF